MGFLSWTRSMAPLLSLEKPGLVFSKTSRFGKSASKYIAPLLPPQYYIYRGELSDLSSSIVC